MTVIEWYEWVVPIAILSVGVGLLLISLAVIALQRQVAALEWWRKKHYEAFMLLFELRKMDAESDIKEDAKQHVNN